MATDYEPRPGADTPVKEQQFSLRQSAKELAGYILMAAVGSGLLAAGVVKYSEEQSAPQPVYAFLPPPHLPEAVRREIGSVVKLIRFNGNTQTDGSGVKVGPQLIDTAGHYELNGNQTSLQPNKVHCYSASTILTRGDYNLKNTSHVAGWLASVNLDPAAQLHTKDIDLEHVFPNRAFKRTPSAPIAKQPVHNGQVVYLEGYASARGQGVDRFPNKRLAEEASRANSTIGNSINIDRPALLPGIVINVASPYIEVATGLGSYDSKGINYASSSTGGDSGGAVFNDKGQLEGLATAVATDRFSRAVHLTAKEILNDFAVQIPLQNARFGVTTVEEVTPQIQHSLEKELTQHDQSCL